MRIVIFKNFRILQIYKKSPFSLLLGCFLLPWSNLCLFCLRGDLVELLDVVEAWERSRSDPDLDLSCFRPLISSLELNKKISDKLNQYSKGGFAWINAAANLPQARYNSQPNVFKLIVVRENYYYKKYLKNICQPSSEIVQFRWKFPRISVVTVRSSKWNIILSSLLVTIGWSFVILPEK